MSAAIHKRFIVAAALSAALLPAAAASSASAAPAAHGTGKATASTKAPARPSKARKLVRRSAAKPKGKPRHARDVVVTIGGPANFTAAGTGCTSPSQQSGGWWYRWCGWDWDTGFGTVALLEYQHQWYDASRGWVAYLSTWCNTSGSCVYGDPNNPRWAYSFFYQ